ncbi:MAG: NAD(P)/FAD-dependent oxidoreductase [Candidatus Eremiobacteraeota bacterium]|nr:NAD(P)/FAD-dependent oxidoreductase [Candidatus Eremiobacteraeota bacterium]
MKHEFDVVVIGTGSAGSAAAFACREGGLKVAIVDKREFGGTCALRGCDPKKVLVSAAEIVERATRMKGHGIAGNTKIDWADLMTFKKTFTDPVPAEREKGYTDQGIVTFHGSAQFVEANIVLVGDDMLQFRNAVIATGAKPSPLKVDGSQHVITSEDFLNLKQLPNRIAFIGGGFISFEFSHIARRAGAQVTILEYAPRALVAFEPSLVDRLAAVGTEIGIDLRLNVDAIEITPNGSEFKIKFSEKGVPGELTADLIVHGAGRIADIDELELSRGQIATNEHGIIVNEYLQNSGNPAIYAAGDCVRAGGLPLTPVAGLEGEIAGKNIAGGNSAVADFSGLASVVYTMPSLASVGLTEEQAKKDGITVKVHTGDSTSWYSARHINASAACYKVLIDENGQIVGAHLLGPNAEELINLFALAIRMRTPASKLKEVLFAWPTAASEIEYMLR